MSLGMSSFSDSINIPSFEFSFSSIVIVSNKLIVWLIKTISCKASSLLFSNTFKNKFNLAGHSIVIFFISSSLFSKT